MLQYHQTDGRRLICKHIFFFDYIVENKETLLLGSVNTQQTQHVGLMLAHLWISTYNVKPMLVDQRPVSPELNRH